MPHVSNNRWKSFVKNLHFDQKLEFGEGDNGLGNGIVCFESATLHPTAVDTIRRYGGSTSPSQPWPEDNTVLVSEADKWERLEQQVKKAMEKLSALADRSLRS